MGVGRSQERIDEALAYIGDGKARYFLADISSQQQVKRLANEVNEYLNGRGLDVLINNAGTFFSYYALSDEGVEMQFAVNVAAPFLLAHLLYEALRRAHGRIVMLSSGSHYKTFVSWNDIQLSRRYRQLQAYKQTKLFAVHLAREFNKRFKGVRAFAADPGLVNTEMGLKDTKGVARAIWKYRKRFGVATEDGAKTSVHLAAEEDLCDEIYWKDCKPRAAAKNAMRDDFSKKIWEYCERLCAIDSDRIIGEGREDGESE